MPSFGSTQDLQKHIQQITLTKIKSYLMNIVANVLKDYVNELVYEANDPSDYERTYELLNSITISDFKKVGNTYKIKVFFDNDKINTYITNDGEWNKHADIYGNSVADELPYYLEYGTNGSLHDKKPARFTQKTYEYFINTNRHIIELKNRLKQQGIIVV